MPWRGFRVSPVRPFLRKREGCIWESGEKTTFIARVVPMLQKGDARKTISLFEEDHQGIRVQPGWLGISSPRSHMGGQRPAKDGGNSIGIRSLLHWPAVSKVDSTIQKSRARAMSLNGRFPNH
jgi:hypothetical protein